jgi:hypothetical protein
VVKPNKTPVLFPRTLKRHALRVFVVLVLVALATPLYTYTRGYLRPAHVEAATGINRQISFQGKLVNPDGTNVTDGSYSIVFSIYTVASAGSNIWTETQSVTLSNGIFQVNLGSVTALPGSVDFNTDNIYLGIKVGADAEMTPRVQFTAVPQAFNAEKLGGLDKTGFIQNQSGSAQTSSSFWISGAGKTDTSFTTPLLQSAAATALTITGNAASTWSTTAGNITIQAGSGTISLGSTTTLNANGALTVSAGGTSALSLTTAGSTVATTGAVTIKSGDVTTVANTSAGTVTVDTGTKTGSGTATLNLGNTNATNINIGGSQTTTLTLGTGLGTISKASTGLTVDLVNGSNSTLTITNSGAGVASISVEGNVSGSTVTSTVATGTAPLNITSTTLVTNLNADLFDGQTGSYYQNASNINAGTLSTSFGGTGANTLTSNGVLYGNGTGAIQATAVGTTGQCLLGNTGAAPSWGSCGGNLFTDGGTFTYLTSVTDDLVIGGSTVAGASLFFDESAGNLYVGTRNT